MPRRRLLLSLSLPAGAAPFARPSHIQAQPGTGSPLLGQPGRAGAAGKPGEDGQPGVPGAAGRRGAAGGAGGFGSNSGQRGNGGGVNSDGGQGRATAAAAVPGRQVPPL